MNWEDYLTEEDKKEIAKDVFRKEVQKEMRDNGSLSTFINNVGYKMIFNMVDDQMDIDSKQLVTDKVKELLSKDMTTFMVFKTSDNYGQRKSVAQQILEDTVNENKNLIQQRVKDVLTNMEERKVFDLIESIQMNATETFVEALLGKNNGK